MIGKTVRFDAKVWLIRRAMAPALLRNQSPTWRQPLALSGNGRPAWAWQIGYICLFILVTGLLSAEAAPTSAPPDTTPPAAEKPPAAPKEAGIKRVGRIKIKRDRRSTYPGYNPGSSRPTDRSGAV